MIFSFFNRPYPHTGDNKRNIINNLLIGLFVTIFLVVFQPFEINLWKTDYKILKLAGFGFVSFLIPTLVSLLNSVLIPAKIKEEKWTVAHEVITILLVLLLIALGNLVYSKLLGITDLTFQNYCSALLVTLIVGVFPVTMHVVRKYNRLLKTNLDHALQMNRQLEQSEQHKLQQPADSDLAGYTISAEHIHLLAENEKDEFILAANELLFIESADNYCNIVYMSRGNKKRELLRSSLKRIEGQLNNNLIIRCHRAYIVNLNNIKNIEGNAAGYKLYFNQTDDCVPVSRAYIGVVNEKMKSIA